MGVDPPSPFCLRCGFTLSPKTLWIGPARATFSWALRRSLAGLSAGWVGWLIIPAANRAVAEGLSQTGHVVLTTLLGGIFLGTVEGMSEESTLKTLRGGLAGILGGLIGGLLASGVAGGDHPDPSKAILSITVAWAIVGAFIGVLSAILEPKRSRLVAGGVGGLFGGALGGWLGYQMYGSLTDILSSPTWWVSRGLESITGAIIGAVLWFVVGLTEKLFVLRRHPLKNALKKTCEPCGHDNPLNAWYCAHCGAVLQGAASPDKLPALKNEALIRVGGALRYASRLSVTTSAVVALLAIVILGSINAFLGLFGLLAATLMGYFLSMVFRAAAEWLNPVR